MCSQNQTDQSVRFQANYNFTEVFTCFTQQKMLTFLLSLPCCLHRCPHHSSLPIALMTSVVAEYTVSGTVTKVLPHSIKCFSPEVKGQSSCTHTKHGGKMVDMKVFVSTYKHGGLALTCSVEFISLQLNDWVAKTKQKKCGNGRSETNLISLRDKKQKERHGKRHNEEVEGQRILYPGGGGDNRWGRNSGRTHGRDKWAACLGW